MNNKQLKMSLDMISTLRLSGLRAKKLLEKASSIAVNNPIDSPTFIFLGLLMNPANELTE